MNYLSKYYPIKLTPIKLILLVSAFIVLTGNFTFFTQVEKIYPSNINNAIFFISLVFFHFSLLSLLMITLTLCLPVRVVVTIFIFLTAALGYYSDQLGIMIDTEMIRTMFETNISETADLLNTGFILHLLLHGLIPAIITWLIPLYNFKLTKQLIYKGKSAFILIFIIFTCIFLASDHYASFFREHKILRNYMHPTASILHFARYIKQELKASEKHDFVGITDNIEKSIYDRHSELIIMVVGETARADHFSLNGYERKTNPKLAMEKNLISYSDISSCGTLTALSVPCMFSNKGREKFDRDASHYTENALDLLKRANVNILWRDNNSSSKGVADRVPYENYRSSKNNKSCDIECRDTGMIEGLQNYINSHDGDILIILHSMGSHGPAYFKRYPKGYEKFTPACNTLELSECSHEEIINAYDNTILYTDYFLSKIIELLKNNSEKHETSMFYVSDHGESLGESGLYLHGIPYMFAPETQTKVPIIIWAGDSADIDIKKSIQLKDVKNSHDAVFYTLMNLFEIQTDINNVAVPPLVYYKEE